MDKEYLVQWEIEVFASNPREAAEKARAMQIDPATTATVFDVYPYEDGIEPVRVDLLEEKP